MAIIRDYISYTKSRDKSKYVPPKYRGISLLSIFSKVYSSVLNTRYAKYLEAVEILNEEQNGFRKGRSYYVIM